MTEYAAGIAPLDSWPWAEYGDALEQAGESEEALVAFDQCRLFGGGDIVETGAAQVLRSSHDYDSGT